jgi:predicted dienelactone hydrolase
MLKSRNWIVLVALALVLQSATKGVHASQPQLDWKLTDIAGQRHAPFDDPTTRAVVLVFISTDCPIANAYQPLLKKLSEKHAEQGVRWFMIHPDPATTTEQAAEHSKQFEIEMPIIVDQNQSIARGVGARVTPEVFVFAKANEKAVYQGRIDDLHAAYGKKRAAATTQELADALRAIVDGQPIAVSKTEPVGCFIAFQEATKGSKADYDPLKVDESKVEQLTLTVDDKDRSREIPTRVYLPKETAAAPVILFSHGLGGSRDNSPYLGNHWARRGFVAVFMQHAGSDDSVWKESRLGERIDAMRKAASGENLKLRVKDVPAVIDQLERWNKEEGHALKGRLDLEHIGMTGHSFGAVTTQAVSGQSYLGRETFTDPRIKCALPMSPSSNKLTKPERTFGKVSIPWLLMTGTNDTSPINDTDVESRLAVYPALPAGSKYELVLDKAEHSAFGERALPGEKGKRNPNHHRAILAISTAFWDAYLKEDPAARKWLDNDEVRQVLDPEDRWQRK